MPANTQPLTRHYEDALNDARHVLSAVRQEADLHRPTPCAGWNLSTLLAHMLGQNHGFATALSCGDADLDAYAPRPVPEPAAVVPAWDSSARQLLKAWAEVAPERRVRLVELAADAPFPAQTVIEIHLLDTVIHTWDVATTLGLQYRPEVQVLDVVAATARNIPTGTSRTTPGAAFAPPVPATTSDMWTSVLTHLGRHPNPM